MGGLQTDGSAAGFPAGGRTVGRLDAVIHRVAHHVRQRVAQAFQNGFVEFDFGSLNPELGLFTRGRAPGRGPGVGTWRRPFRPAASESARTASWSSDVTRLTRWAPVRMPRSSCRASDSFNWLRLSTSSPASVIRESSRVTLRRMVASAAETAGGTGGAGAAGAAAGTSAGRGAGATGGASSGEGASTGSEMRTGSEGASGAGTIASGTEFANDARALL